MVDRNIAEFCALWHGYWTASLKYDHVAGVAATDLPELLARSEEAALPVSHAPAALAASVDCSSRTDLGL